MGRGAAVKDTIIGTSLSPAHVPYPSDQDVATFFDEAAQIGNHITWIIEWQQMPPIETVERVRQVAMLKGFKFHLYLSPIALTGGRKSPAIPAIVGASSFGDERVHTAFVGQAMALAALRPDYLGLGTEVNFLDQNPREFDAYVALVHEAYRAIKREYPAQIVTISFQWDVMRAHQQYSMLTRFADTLDAYSFTSYPDAFGDVPAIAADYYSSVRRVLPDQRLGFSKLGWSSAAPSNEDLQAAFWRRIPELMKDARPEFVTLALLHDVSVFSGDLARLNYVGIRTIDDRPKKSWPVLVTLPPMH